MVRYKNVVSHHLLYLVGHSTPIKPFCDPPPYLCCPNMPKSRIWMAGSQDPCLLLYTGDNFHSSLLSFYVNLSTVSNLCCCSFSHSSFVVFFNVDGWLPVSLYSIANSRVWSSGEQFSPSSSIISSCCFSTSPKVACVCSDIVSCCSLMLSLVIHWCHLLPFVDVVSCCLLIIYMMSSPAGAVRWCPLLLFVDDGFIPIQSEGIYD